MAGAPQSALPWYEREDTWAIIIGLGLTFLITIAFFAGGMGFFKTMAVSISSWEFGKMDKLWVSLGKSTTGMIYLFVFFMAAFCVAAKTMKLNVGNYAAGFTVLFIISLFITALGGNGTLKWFQLETPVLALLFGMLVSNLVTLPGWFKSALKTEFYVKTGIVLMGATLPFTIILQAGPMAMLQATIVAATTFFSIFFAATKLFGLDPRFGACLGAGGSICGVSGAIAIGGACRAEKEHVSVAISLVIVWAVVMVVLLPIWCKALGMDAGPAGAWIGTSEFADAAGFAAAANMGDERAIKTFTLMKVVGRDMFVGIWALMVAYLSVTVWEKKDGNGNGKERVDIGEIWRRFPKFVIGFFVASIFTTILIASVAPKVGAAYSKDALGVIKTLRGWTFTWTFLSIGFTTRFRELTATGWKPFAAFTIGVLINVPLGYWLSNHVFVDYWLNVK